MAQFEQWFNQDFTEKIEIRHCESVMFTGDDKGALVGVRLFSDGAAYSAGGTVTGAVKRSDGGLVALTGTLSGNAASVVIPAAALAYSGPIGVHIVLNQGGSVTTVLKAIYSVDDNSGVAVDPGTIIPSVNDLITAINTAVASIPSDYSALLHTLAPDFSASNAYNVGDYVWYNGTLYRFTTDHAAGAWTGLDAKSAVVGNDLSDLKDLIGTDFVYNPPYFMQGYINSDNKYQGMAGESANKSALIPVQGGEKLKITSNEDRYTYYAAIRSFNNPNTGDDPDFSIETDWNTNHKLDANSVVETTVPSDAKYLVILLGQYNNNAFSRCPVSVVINGYDYLQTVKSNIDSLCAFTSECENKANEAATLLNKKIDAEHGFISFISDTEKTEIDPGLFVYSNNGFVFVDGAHTGGNRVLRLTKSFVFTSSSNAKNWDDGITLEEGSDYEVSCFTVSGEVTIPVIISVYPLGESSTIGSAVTENGKYTRTFTAPTGKLNISLYVYRDTVFSDCIFCVTLRKVGMQVSNDFYVPTYYDNEMNDTIHKVTSEITEPSTLFLVTTDIHRYMENADIPETFLYMRNTMKQFAESVKSDFVLANGDLINGNKIRSVSMQEAWDITSDFLKVGAPYYCVVGNHDSNRYSNNTQTGNMFTMEELYSAIMSANRNVVYNDDTNGTDYYFDIPNSDLRCVIINGCNFAYRGITYDIDQKTIDWISAKNVLDSSKTIIMFMHLSPVLGHSYGDNYCDSRNKLKPLLNTFVSGGGKLVIITGHAHVDGVFIDPYTEITLLCQKCQAMDISVQQYDNMKNNAIDGINNYQPTPRTYEDVAWTACLYKHISDELSMIRFGRGADTYIHCTHITPSTVSTKLSSATWHTSNEDVATVNNGVITGIGTGKCAIFAKDNDGNMEIWIVDVA